MPPKPSETTVRVLSILNFPDNLRQRIKLQALKLNLTQSEVAVAIIEANLPKFEEILGDNWSFE